MNIIIWVIFGALAGWLASLIMGTDARQGWLTNIIVGIVGAFIGGFIMNALGYSGVNGFDIYSILVAVGGAVVLLWLYRLVAR
jgi:uncharacterized membrane protein YeaQ/YmgE (transglycosylase-associated protein family)